MDLVEVRQSSLPGAGDGVFALKRIEPGQRITLYDGEVVSPARYFAMDTMRDPRIHYTLHSASRGIVVATNIDGTDPTMCGHKVNDALSISRDDALGYEHELEGYIAAYSGGRPRPWNVKVVNDGEGSYIEAERQIDVGEELFMCYGVAYWASRVYSTKFWNADDLDDRQLARELYSTAVTLCARSNLSTELPSLPKRAGLMSTSANGDALWDLEANTVLRDEDLTAVGLALFNRDLAVLRLKKPDLRSVIIAAMKKCPN